MFWGCQLKQGQDHNLAEQAPEDMNVLHLSNITLGSNSENSGKNYIYATVEDKKYVIAVIDSAKSSHVTCDLYFDLGQDPVFSVQGKGEVFLAGYFEPGEGDEEDIDDEEFEKIAGRAGKLAKAQEDDDEEEDDEESDDATPAALIKKPQQQQKPAQQQVAKSAAQVFGQSPSPKAPNPSPKPLPKSLSNRLPSPKLRALRPSPKLRALK
jgi:hypothetical protein